MASDQSILMPKLGLTMTEGVLAEWKIAPGDRVKAGDTIFVVETDKISNEIEAAEDGVVGELLVKPGDLVPVGHVLGTWAGDGAGKAEAPTPVADAPRAEPAPAPAPASAPAAPALSAPHGQVRQFATPLARRMAADAGVALESVKGSGPRGRVMADDVTAMIQTKPAPAPAAAPAVAAPVPAPAPVAGPVGEIVPLGQFQKVTGRRLLESKQQIPHFYVFAEADVTDLLDLRVRLNADAGALKLTVNHFIVTAVARALAKMPEFNRVWSPDGKGLVQLPQVDVGVAIESLKGLVAPLLRDLGNATVDDVAFQTGLLIDRAKNGRFAPPELMGGATTVSNVGMFGATGLIPIVNPGQSSILGVGRNKPTFLPDGEGKPVLRQIIGLALSCDHRVVDGALAARFLHLIQSGLEAPFTLLRRSPQGPAQ